MSTSGFEIKSYVDSRHEVDMTGNNGAVVTIDLNPGCPNDCCGGITRSTYPAGSQETTP
jgi:hypothetical protein